MSSNTPSAVQLRLDVCLWCNKPLPQGRYDRKTHEACRIKLYRWKKKLQSKKKLADNSIAHICEMMNYPITFEDGVEALKDIQRSIQLAYDCHNIVRVK